MRLLLSLALILATSSAFAQTQPSAPTPATGTLESNVQPAAGPEAPSPSPVSQQQPKRILGLMPNFRAVSAGELPPPPTPKQSFMIATRNSFDYSSFIFVGLTSAIAEGTDAHPQLGKGMNGFGRYYWRGFADKTIGNYLVLFALPTVFHQDERYFSLGKGGAFRRMSYAASRVFIAPDYHGRSGFNTSEVLGLAMAQAISISYYPSQDRTGGKIAKKYAFALGRDALTNALREFWPDIATHVFHRKP